MTQAGGIPTDPEDIARELAPELAPTRNADWLDLELTQFEPGLFYHNNIVYLTITTVREKLVNVGSKSKPVWEKKTMPDTMVITSNRDNFWLEEAAVTELGLAWNPHTSVNKSYLGWSTAAAKAFVDGNSTEPDPWDLFIDLRSIWEKHVEYGNDRHYDILPLFVMSSYVFPLFEAMGYIHFHGTAGAGKSQNLNLIKAFAMNCIWASSATGSSIFRKIASTRGTILVDEAENWESESQQELLRILKGGYQDGAIVSRTERSPDDAKWVVAEYATYSPKVIASIAPQDQTLTQRCIVVTMRPAIRQLPLFRHQDPQWQPLRDRLHLWAMYHMPKISALKADWEGEKRTKYAPDIQNRPWQVTMPYLLLADYIGGETLVRPLAQFFTEYYRDAAKASAVLDRTRLLLKALPRVLQEKTHYGDNYYPYRDIHSVVIEYLDEDTKDQYKIRSVSRALSILGFKDARPDRHTGTQVRLNEDEVRLAFSRWRMEPQEEDRAWLDGETDYQHASPVSPLSPVNLWQLGEEDGEHS